MGSRRHPGVHRGARRAALLRAGCRALWRERRRSGPTRTAKQESTAKYALNTEGLFTKQIQTRARSTPVRHKELEFIHFATMSPQNDTKRNLAPISSNRIVQIS